VIEAVDTRARGLGTRRGEAVGAASIVRRLDWILLAATGALVAYGLWAVAGITRHDVAGNANYYVVRQGVYVGIGLAALIVAVFVDPEYYRRYRRPIYACTLGLMVIVLLTGAVTRGSKRWLDLGFFKFQPS
jgi:cell division protein FtsW (lipid II flippase)